MGINIVGGQTIIKSCGSGQNQLCKGLSELGEWGDLCQFGGLLHEIDHFVTRKFSFAA